MPKKFIKAAKSKAQTASAKIGEMDLQTKVNETVTDVKSRATTAQEVASATKTRLSETPMARKSIEGAQLAKDNLERATDNVKENAATLAKPVAEKLTESEIGQQAIAGLNEARKRTADAATDATATVREGIDKATGAFAVIHGSSLMTATSGNIETARDKVYRLLNGRENSIASTSITLQVVMDNLSSGIPDGLYGKFKVAGLQGRDLAYRNPAETADFYERSMPDTVKMLSEFSQRLFLDGKDASHEVSYKNNPDLARESSNLMWEDASTNRARGADNMTTAEVMSANRANALQGFALGVAEIAVQSTLYAIAIEATISITENVIYVYRGGKDVPTAIEDTLKNTAKAGLAGAVAGVVVGVGITTLTAVGAAPVLIAIAPAVAVVGGGLVIYRAGKRIHKALTTPIYEDGVIIGTDLVRCCADDDERVTETQLVKMMKDAEPDLTPMKPDTLLQLPPGQPIAG